LQVAQSVDAGLQVVDAVLQVFDVSLLQFAGMRVADRRDHHERGESGGG
jgi:hypothetical protein